MDAAYGRDEAQDEELVNIPKANLLDLNKRDLIELIRHLEHDVHSRDAVIRDLMNQQTKQAFYRAKYGRFGITDPFTALQRDSEQVLDDQFDHDQVKSSFDDQLQQLENLIETQRRAQATIREQKLSADENYKKVYKELEEARKRHAHDTAQGDDVTVALEKEREKLEQNLAYTKSQLKSLEKELKKTKSHLSHQIKIATKHKQVALDLIKERRKMVSKMAEAEKQNKTIADLLLKEQEERQKFDDNRLLQLEARMEKQLMDFDIEREQYKVRLRKEESKVKDLLHQLTDIKKTVLSLHHDTPDSNIASIVTTQTLSNSVKGHEVVANALSGSVVISRNHSVPPPAVLSTSLTSHHHLQQRVVNAVESKTSHVDLGPSRLLSSQPPGDSKLAASAQGSQMKHSTALHVSSTKPSTVAQSSPQSRISYYRSAAGTSQVSNRSSNVSSPKLQHASANKHSESIPSPILASGTSIPTRVFSKAVPVTSSVATNIHTPKKTLKITATSNVGSKSVMASIPTLVSTAPAPLSGDEKVIHVSNWKSLPSGSDAGNTSVADKPTVMVKPKPPPPVRNVSLPPSKKFPVIENTS